MARTLREILIDANSVLDLEAAVPTGDELTLRANYANQAIWDAAATGQFNELKAEYLVATSTLATISLPTNFREFQVNPMLSVTGGWDEFEEIEAEEKFNMSDSDKYCYVLGNPQEGYNAIFHGLTAGCTLSIIYQRFPTGLLTLTDKCELPDPTFVTRKIESYVLYSRTDERFPIANALAEQKLLNMSGREMKGAGGQSRDTRMKFANPLR